MIHLDLKKGDCVLFHPLLVHGSGINRSDQCRKAMTCFYSSANFQIHDKKYIEQNELFCEWLKMMKNRYKLHYDDYLVRVTLMIILHEIKFCSFLGIYQKLY